MQSVLGGGIFSGNVFDGLGDLPSVPGGDIDPGSNQPVPWGTVRSPQSQAAWTAQAAEEKSVWTNVWSKILGKSSTIPLRYVPQSDVLPMKPRPAIPPPPSGRPNSVPGAKPGVRPGPGTKPTYGKVKLGNGGGGTSTSGETTTEAMPYPDDGSTEGSDGGITSKPWFWPAVIGAAVVGVVLVTRRKKATPNKRR